MPWILSLTLIGSIAILIGIALFFGRGQALDRLFAADPLADKRARAFPTVLSILWSYFPLGSGFGSFDTAFRRAEPFNLLETTYFNQAHNDLAQVVLEGGLPGLILLVVSIGWLGHASMRLWRTRSKSGVVIRGRAACVALLLTLVASAVDYPLRAPVMMAVACALIFQIAAALDSLRQVADGRGGKEPG